MMKMAPAALRALRKAAMLALLGAACTAVAEPAPADVPQAYRVAQPTRAPLVGLTHAGPRLIAVGDYGVIVLSDDAGATWRQARAVATRELLTAVTFVDANRGFAVGHGGTILRTDDAGESWMRVREAPDEGPLLAVWFEDARHGIAVGAFGVAIETRDGGTRWTRVAVGEGDLRDRHLNGIVALGDATLLITAEAGALFRSGDGGHSWSLQKVPYNGSLWGGLALRDGAVLVFGMRGHVLRSDDQGRTFTDIPSGTNQSLTAGAQRADGTIVLVGLGGTIAQSIDGGRAYEVTVRPERQTFTALVEAASGLVLTATTGVVKPMPATR